MAQIGGTGAAEACRRAVPGPQAEGKRPQEAGGKEKTEIFRYAGCPEIAPVTACFRGPGRDHHHRQELDPFLNSQHKEVFTYGNQEKRIA